MDPLPSAGTQVDRLHAANQADGRVLVVAQGPRQACDQLLDLLQSGATPGRVDNVVADFTQAGEPLTGFRER